jgi:hypothetical protein
MNHAAASAVTQRATGLTGGGRVVRRPTSGTKSSVASHSSVAPRDDSSVSARSASPGLALAGGRVVERSKRPSVARRSSAAPLAEASDADASSSSSVTARSAVVILPGLGNCTEVGLYFFSSLLSLPRHLLLHRLLLLPLSFSFPSSPLPSPPSSLLLPSSYQARNWPQAFAFKSNFVPLDLGLRRLRRRARVAGLLRHRGPGHPPGLAAQCGGAYVALVLARHAGAATDRGLVPGADRRGRGGGEGSIGRVEGHAVRALRGMGLYSC